MFFLALYLSFWSSQKHISKLLFKIQKESDLCVCTYHVIYRLCHVIHLLLE